MALGEVLHPAYWECQFHQLPAREMYGAAVTVEVLSTLLNSVFRHRLFNPLILLPVGFSSNLNNYLLHTY